MRSTLLLRREPYAIEILKRNARTRAIFVTKVMEQALEVKRRLQEILANEIRE
jgi:hypothetical protein